MSEVIGVGQLSLMDLNDAIISGVPPKDPSVGSLWIDESLDPPMLKKWNGEGWIDLGELDPNLSVIIEDITETLGNMANDNIINFQERQVIKDKLTEIIGYVIADSTTVLPTTATLDNGGKGGFWSVRKSATNAGISTSDSVYVNLTTRYNNLKSYLESLTPIDAWDVRSANKDVVIAVTKSTFRDRWLQYYLAVDALAEATANKLKENIDKIDVNGRNFITNGGFLINLDESTWKDYYVGNVKEIVDISAETPPMQFALHVKNTANVNGGIFTPVIFEGAVAESLIGREITVSFWLKYQNIVQGLNSTNLGRFGEIVIEGRKGDNSKVYSYQRVGANGSFGSTYISGTNMTWTKYQGTLKIEMPAGAVAITNISFKHGLEGCKGEFWTTALKLETGNKATDWTPNPLDVEGRVTTVESKVLPDRIVQTVRSSETYKRDLADAKTHADTVAGAVQKDVDDLETAVGNLDKEIKGTFKDGLVTEAEAKSIAKYINILNAEKLDVDNRYNIIYADSNLSGTPKTNLLSAKSGYNTAHNNLMKSINDAVADGKATSTESANVDSKFNSYRSALGILSTRFEEAIRAIETSKVDNIDIGGTNLLVETRDFASPWDTGSNYTTGQTDVYGDSNAVKVKGGNIIFGYNVPQANMSKFSPNTFTFSAWFKADKAYSTPRFGYRNGTATNLPTTTITTEWKRISFTFTTTNETTAGRIIYWYSDSDTSNNLYVCYPKLEYGNKATGWSPAPEDSVKAITGVRDSVDEVYRGLGSLDEEIKGTFKDGLVSEAEAKSIEKYLNVVNSEKSQLDSRYNTVYADPSLSGTPKSTLATKKSAYNTAHSNLISSITKAIADGKATTSEKSDVDSKFASYRSALSELSIAFEDAVSSIAQAKADKSARDTELYVQSRGENLVTNGTGLLGDNTNFSQFNFDGTQVYAGGGSFHTALQNGTRFSDELIPIDPSRKYRASFMAKSKTGLGHNYAGFVTYDIDRLRITSQERIACNFPVVELARDLKKGDTIVYLKSTDGFRDDQGDNSHYHTLIMWGYTNSFGYEYPAGTYSKYVFSNAWRNGAIDRTNNTITLSKPFDLVNKQDPNGIFKAGHKLSRTHSGSGYLYTIASNVKYPTEWTKFEGYITGTGDRAGYNGAFPHGSAFAQFLFLTNRSTSGGTAGDESWYNSIELTDITFEENAKSHADTIVSAVRKEVEGVDTKVGNLDKEIKGTFKDGIVSEAEAQSISKYINTLSSEKLGVDNRYSTIYSDSKLSGTAKSNLSSAKSSFDTAHNNLITSINNAVKDGKATSAESADVDSKFTSYRSALGTLSTRLEEAVRAIEDSKVADKVSTTVYNQKIGSIETALGKVTTTAGETEKTVNDLTGTVDTISTDLSELIVETGKISSTVSSVKTTADTAKRDIDNLEIGGRNLLKNSMLNIIDSTTYNIASLDITEEIPEGTTVTVSLKGSLGEGKSYFGLYNSGGSVSMGGLYPSDKGEDGVYRGTFTWRVGTSSNTYLNVYHMPNAITTPSSIEWIKLEKGNKATDWTNAPEELDEKVSTEDVTASLQTVAEEYTSAIVDATSALSETIAEDIASMESSITTAYNTAIEQSATDINISINTVNERIDGTQSEITEVKSFFNFSDEGLTIGRSDSPLSINISNTRMEFRDSGTAVAYIDKQTMYIENVHTLQSFIVGNHKIERHDGDITIIKWIG